MTASTEKIYEACPPADIPFDPSVVPSTLQLTDSQRELYDNVLKHFDREEYVIPGIKGGSLMEEEKFWLVRLPYWSLFRDLLTCTMSCIPER